VTGLGDDMGFFNVGEMILELGWRFEIVVEGDAF